jgi:hypothetical protein
MDTNMGEGAATASNRRKSPRKQLSIPCALRVGENVYSGRLLDISDGGAFVQTAQSLASGVLLSLIFKARVRKKTIYLNLKARVVYVGRFLQGYENFYGFGAQFGDLSPKTAAKLGDLIGTLRAESCKKYEFM